MCDIIYSVSDTEIDDVTLATAAALRVAIARSGISQNEVGRRAGLSSAYMSKLRKAEQSPRFSEWLAIADALGIDERELLETYLAELDRIRRERA